MMQNLQLYRGKKGMDTMFDHNEDSVQVEQGIHCQNLLLSQVVFFLGGAHAAAANIP